MRPTFQTAAFLLALCLATGLSGADDTPYRIVIKDHRFVPESLTIPAGEKVKIEVDNQDPTPEEFESHDFNREKVIGGNRKAIIYVGPLKPGTYAYFGEFHPETARGTIIAQ